MTLIALEELIGFRWDVAVGVCCFRGASASASLSRSLLLHAVVVKASMHTAKAAPALTDAALRVTDVLSTSNHITGCVHFSSN